jgi:hypothetical protein
MNLIFFCLNVVHVVSCCCERSFFSGCVVVCGEKITTRRIFHFLDCFVERRGKL